MAPDARPSARSRPLIVLRRIYLYFVAFYSLTFLQTSVRNVGQDLGFLWTRRTGNLPVITDEYLMTILEQSSLALVAALFFMVHWSLAQGYVYRIPGERASIWRKLFLFLTVAVALYFSSAYVAELVRWPLLLIGKPAAFMDIVWSMAMASLLSLLLSGTVLWHFVHVIYQEREAGADSRLVGILTGLWCAIIAAFALGLLLANTNEGLFFLWHEMVFRFVPTALREIPRTYLSEVIAVAWVSLAVLVYLEQFRRRMVQGQWPIPAASFHATFLYLGQLAGIGLMAVGTMDLLAELLPELGDGAALLPPHYAFYLPVVFVVGPVCWLWFHRELRRTVDPPLAGPWMEFLWQSYHYILATLGLIWMVRGCAGVIRHFLDAMVEATDRGLTSDLSASIGELVVALPILFLAWRAIVTHTLQPARPDFLRLGIWPRRVYLYGVSLVTTLSLLFLVGQALYEFLQWLVVQSAPDSDLPGEWILVMAVTLLIHLLGLWRDRKIEESLADPAPDERIVLRQKLAQMKMEEIRIQERIAALQQALEEAGETSEIPGEETVT